MQSFCACSCIVEISGRFDNADTAKANMANTLADTNALHVNASAGIQGNHTQIGGSHNRQYNAETIHVKNISARPETPPSPSSTLLPRPDPNFVDREKLLEHIRARSSVLGAWVALVGLGGVGYGMASLFMQAR